MHGHERLVSSGELQRLAVEEMRLRQAVVEADEEPGPVHPPFGAEDSRNGVVRGDFLAAAIVEREDFDFSVEAGGHQVELVACGGFEVKPSDRLEMLMKNVERKKRFGCAIRISRNIPEGNAAADETGCQNALATTFLVPCDLRHLQKVVAIEKHVVLLQLADYTRFDG